MKLRKEGIQSATATEKTPVVKALSNDPDNEKAQKDIAIVRQTVRSKPESETMSLAQGKDSEKAPQRAPIMRKTLSTDTMRLRQRRIQSATATEKTPVIKTSSNDPDNEMAQKGIAIVRQTVRSKPESKTRSVVEGTYREMDEKKYCVCQKPEAGMMIGCDNPLCKYEWFHYTCVGIKRKPRGKWYCENCRQ